jgi:HSP20 family protein
MLHPRLIGFPALGAFRQFDELSRMRRQMDRLMDAMWERPASVAGAGVFPAINLTEDDNFFYVRAELPGVAADDLDIQATARNMTISGERKLALENKARYHRREREGGRFSRALALPKEIDAERIEARMLNGLLILKVPKSESAKPRRITIDKQG